MSVIFPNTVVGSIGDGVQNSIARWKTISEISSSNNVNTDNSGQLAIGSSVVNDSMLHITCSDVDKIGLKIKATNGQTADLFEIKSYDDSCLFLINYQGDTGITVCSPNEPLHIQSDFDGNRGVRMGNESDGTSAVGRFIVDVLGGSAFLAAYGSNFTTSGSRRAGSGSLIANASLINGLSLVARHPTDGNIRFYAGGNADENEYMTITYNGKVGIGTALSIDSTAKLEIDGNIYPHADDSYYLGKNDDDTPLSWKGIILKDTTNGKYYRIEIINGVITATDLTD